MKSFGENNYHYNHYNSFAQNIKACAFKKENICLNIQKSCVIKMPFPTLMVPVVCACNKPFKQKCMSDYCTKDIDSCVQLKNNIAGHFTFKNCSFGRPKKVYIYFFKHYFTISIIIK